MLENIQKPYSINGRCIGISCTWLRLRTQIKIYKIYYRLLAMYHPQYSLRVVPMLQASRVSHQHQAVHLAQEVIQVQEHKVPILVLLKVCQYLVDHQMDHPLGEFLPRLRVEVLLFLEEMQHRHHLVFSRRVIILNTAQDQQGHPVKDHRYLVRAITVLVDKSFPLHLEPPKVIMDILPINKGNHRLDSLDHKEVILQIHNHIVVIMEELHLQIVDILHQELRHTTRKDLEVLQVLDSIHIPLLGAITRQVHLLQEAPLTHIPLLLGTHTQETPLLIQIAIIPPPLVEITLRHLSLVLLLDIPLNPFHLLLKTRMYHQIHQMCLQEGQDIHLQIHMRLQ